MKSLPGYYNHIAERYPRTYIDKYPKTIINIDKIRQGILLEFGAGAANDILWLFNQGIPPDRLMSIESDPEACRLARSRLDDELGLWSILHLPLDARNTGYPDEMVDFIYANNLLHCLDSREDISIVLSEGYRLLKPRGIFFGRTLSDEIHEERLAAIAIPQNSFQTFALETAKAVRGGRLIGISPSELENLAKSTGFSHTYTELKEHSWKPTVDFYFRCEK